MEKTDQTAFLSNRRISTRFRLVQGIQIVALFITVGAIILSLPQLFDGFNELRNAQDDLLISSEIETGLLQARQQEKDFFLRYNNVGYREALRTYAQSYTSSIEAIQSATENLANPQENPNSFDITNANLATQVDEQITIYQDQFDTVAETLIPQRNSILISINAEFTELDEIAAFQGHARTISALRDLQNKITIYQWRIQPAHATFDEFKIVQTQLIADYNASHTGLTETIENATISQRAKDDMITIIGRIDDEFNDLSALDNTIAIAIRELREATVTADPLVTELINNSDLHFEQANDNFLSLLSRVGVFVIGAIVISSIIILILIPIITRTIEEPIELMAEATQEMAQGNYERRLDYHSEDEIGQLAMSFNQMGEAIQQRNLQLNSALEEAREANRLKDEFLATMSHELRTPLNAIIGFLGIISMTANLSEKNTHRLSRAMLNSERLLGLINNILDISRIEAGRMKISKTPVNLRELVEDLQSQLDVLLEEKDVEFTVDIDDSIPEEVMTDEDAIAKIITNLSGNAMKFTESGEVSVKLFTKPDNATWIIQVRDTGIGIPVHMRETIFDRFRQVDGSSTREHGGSGLGLAIVSGLCREMDGTITVDSEVGKGSIFTITLPLEQPEEIVTS